jgi:short-subunit dehydrogenase
MDPSVESQVMETNVIGVVRSTKAFLPFLAKGGAIVNIGSYM